MVTANQSQISCCNKTVIDITQLPLRLLIGSCSGSQVVPGLIFSCCDIEDPHCKDDLLLAAGGQGKGLWL